MWLNLPSRATAKETSDKDELFLSSAALRTWRYFAEFSTAEHNWLIPDNVQEEPAAIAGRISPTNLGFLLNARQAACEFGFLTVPEFAEQTLRTLATMAKLPRSHGHLLNWYDTRTLQPLQPRFVSAVDSGNLVASLGPCSKAVLICCIVRCWSGNWRKDWPIIFAFWWTAMRSRKSVSGYFKTQMKKKSWLPRLLAPSEEGLLEIDSAKSDPEHEAEVRWFAAESLSRLRNLRKAVQVYAPWMLPEFVPLWNDSHAELQIRLAKPDHPAACRRSWTRYGFVCSLLSTTPTARATAKRFTSGCRPCCRRRVRGRWI